MSAKHIATLGNPSQVSEFITDGFLKGQSEPRIALVGRSNVGKSSLINALTESKLAQTSKKPGKTRLIHFYLWHEPKVILADLPGYGYAAAAKTDLENWAKFIAAYLDADPGLHEIWWLLDARHGPIRTDLEAVPYLRDLGVPILPVFTKTDQVKNQKERAARQKEVKQALGKLGYTEGSGIWTSVKSETGFKELMERACQPRLSSHS